MTELVAVICFIGEEFLAHGVTIIGNSEEGGCVSGAGSMGLNV